MSRTIEVIPPGGPEWGFVFERLTGWEGLGRPFWFDVDLLSKRGDVDKAKVLGEPMTVALMTGPDDIRYFSGVVARFAQVAWTGDMFRYRAQLRPWLWLLSRTSNSRVFQPLSVKANPMTIPTIVEKVFQDHKLTDFDLSPLAKGENRFSDHDYCVQYQETDFNFVSRLMESEGIYYYFTHALGKHQMLVADSVTALKSEAGYEEVPYFPPEAYSADRRERDHIDGWSVELQIQPGSFAAKDYDFEKPTAPLFSNTSAPGANQHYSTFEMFEYPGRRLQDPQRQLLTDRRLEEQQLEYEQAVGTGNARGIIPGAIFKLTDYPGESEERTWLVTSASYALVSNDYSSGDGTSGPDYRVNFRAIDSKRQYRPPLVTPRPTVQGPQTAVVVGEKGAEISTDKYGRVKVQFPWDREGKFDENSSIFVRVSQAWAGTKWGALHVPRIGQEVIVDFLEGDPDQPIITGRVYNADNMPPYLDPNAPTDTATQSGIKSRSTPGGGPNNYNEIKFEDKKGKEELHIQAERDQSTHVKRNQSISVDGDRSVSVGGNESISVTGTRTSTITKKETQTFKDAREMTVQLTDTNTITGNHIGTYKSARTETVGGGDTLTVNKSNKLITVHGEYNTVADTQFQVTQKGDNQILVKDGVVIKNASCKIELKAGAATITAADEITLTCGGASISLKKDGTIEVTGAKKVSANGGGSGLELIQAGATMTGPKATVSGASMTEITGAMVKIN